MKSSSVCFVKKTRMNLYTIYQSLDPVLLFHGDIGPQPLTAQGSGLKTS